MAKLKIGTKAIPFSLPGVDEEEHNLGDYVDQDIIVIYFTCNHCPYVQAWDDRVIQLQSDYVDKGVQFIAINSNDVKKYPADSFPNMQTRAEEKGFNFPYLYDETQEVARFYKAERTPEFFLFDQHQKLQYHGALDDNFDNPQAVQKQYLHDALEAVLAGETPPVTETPPVGCTIKWK